MRTSSATPRCSRAYRRAGRRFFRISRRFSKPVALSHTHLWRPKEVRESESGVRLCGRRRCIFLRARRRSGLFEWTPPNFCANQRGGSKGIFMRLVRLRAPGGLENLKLVEEDHPKPRPGELLVRIRASSLNFRDDWVVLGKIPCADGRIPLSDGAEEVSAVGDDVEQC